MRDLLTWCGIALIALFCAALAAPLLIDNEAWRLPLASRLSALSGATVRLDGPIALQILPTPRLEAENFSASAPAGSLRAHHAVIELALPSLLQGKWRIAAARFDGGELFLEANGGGAATPLVDALSLKNFRVAVVSARRVVAQSYGVDLEGALGGAEAGFSAQGGFVDGWGQKIRFSMAAEPPKLAKTGLQSAAKARLSWPGDFGALTLDGLIAWSAKPSFEGAAQFSGAPVPGGKSGGDFGAVTAAAQAVIGADGLWLRDIDGRLGEGALAPKFSGSLKYPLEGGARPTLVVAVDRLDAGWSAALEGWASAATWASAAGPGWNGEWRLAAAQASWRGLEWGAVELTARPGAPLNLRASGPGATRLDWRAMRADQGFRGVFSLSSEDFSAFAAQWPALAGARSRRVDLAGDLTLGGGAGRLALSRLALDGANFTGELAYVAAPREKITARLSTPELDLDAAPGFSALSGEQMDVDLSLSAAKLVSGKARGAAQAMGGRLDLQLRRELGAVRLDRLELAAPGGGVLTASGGWGANFAAPTGEAHLQANDLAPIAGALARLFPASWSAQWARRARILSPAEFLARADAGGVRVDGAFAATRLTLTAPQAAAPWRNFALEASAPEAGALLAQLGVETVWPQKLGPAKLQLAQSGEGGATTGALELAGLHGEFSGARKGDAFSGAARLTGSAEALTALGFGAAPLDLAARMALDEGTWRFEGIAGTVGGAKISGELAFDGEGGRGRLSADRLSAPAALALVLGSPAPAKAGAWWSSLSFAPVLVDPPVLRLAVETEHLAPLEGPAHFDLTLGPGRLTVERGEAALAGGILRGELDLRRSAGQATLRGDLRAENLALANSALSARLDGALKFAGGGGSAAALIGALAGEGEVTLRDLSLAQAASGASAKIAQEEATTEEFDAQRPARALDRAFAAGTLRRDRAVFALRLAEGVAALTPQDTGAAGLQARFDLRDGGFYVAFRDAPASGADEAAGVVSWSGPWAAPERKIDATGLVNLLATRALEREHLRIERQKAEDRARLAPAPN